MAIKTWTEEELKSLIKDIIKQELKNVLSSINSIKEKQKKQIDEDKVKEIVRETLVNMYKYLWQKSGNYIKQI